MALAMAGFTCGDALVKTVTPMMNIGQIMLVRGAMTTVAVYFIARHFGALRHWRVILQPMLMWRILFEVLAAITYLTALGLMPLANAAAILQSLPLAVTLGAALFLGEPVGWRRWSAIVSGFLGVLIILRPGPEGFNEGAIYVVVCVLFAAGRDLTTKRIRSDVPSLMVTVVTAAATTLTGAFLTVPMGGWQPMSLASILYLSGASIFVLIGYQFLILSMRTGDISFVAPFRYTSLLWAIPLGFLVFGDVPDIWMLSGVVVVIGSGLYAFYRENKRRTELAGDAASAPEAGKA